MSAPAPATLREPCYGHLVGDSCPGFSVRGVNGEIITDSDLHGAPALIIFFPFAFTPICDHELTELENEIRRFDEVGIIAISCDPPAGLRAWQEQRDFSFEVASDFWPHGNTARAFGVFDEASGHPRRASFLLDPRGGVAWSVVNPAGQPRPVQGYLDAIDRFDDPHPSLQARA